MTTKSVKDMEKDISLKNKQIVELTASYKSLATKYEELQTKYKQVQSRNPRNFQCSLCEDSFSLTIDLKTHIKTKHAGSLKCDKCEKVFDAEWKLSAHLKNHKEYPCDKCEKVFNYEEARSRHKTAVHEHVKIYCHFFNNKKVCPFEKQCIFLHEDSQDCKYGKICEREYCMYKHVEDETGDDGEKNAEDVVENNHTVEEINLEDEVSNISLNDAFVNPPQEISELFKCDKCDFQACFVYMIENHTTDDHPMYCCRCKEEFKSKTQCRKHKQKIHNIKPY